MKRTKQSSSSIPSMNLKTQLFLAYCLSGFALASIAKLKIAAAASPPIVLDLSMANLIIPFLLWTGLFALLWLVILSANRASAYLLAIVVFGITGLWWAFWTILILFDQGFQGRAHEFNWVGLSLLVGVVAGISGAVLSAKFSQELLRGFDRSTAFLWLMGISFGGAMTGMIGATLLR